MMITKKSLTTSVIFSLFITFLFVQTPSVQAIEYQSPRTLSLGGSGRGAPMLNDSIYLNPSYASFIPSYNLSFGYNWFDSDRMKGRNYNASVQDSRTELFQAGMGFTRREQNSAINIGASKQIIQRLGVGLGSKILIDDHTNNMNSDMIFSTSFIASSLLYASFIVDNLFEGQSIKDRHLYRTFFLGSKWRVLKEVEVYFDPFYSPNYVGGKKGGFSLGLELSLLSDFYMRFGKFQNAEVTHIDTRGDGFGLGVGWIGPRINFDYAMHRVTAADNGASLTTSHSLSATIFF